MPVNTALGRNTKLPIKPLYFILYVQLFTPCSSETHALKALQRLEEIRG